MTVSRCPKCRVELEQANYCSDCGWVRPRGTPQPTQRQPIACSFDGCPNPAELRVRVGPRMPGKERHAWANVCAKHELALLQKETDDWMRATGLERRPGESVVPWRRRTLDWLKANGEKQKRVRGFRTAGALLVRQREPGDDDEEVAA